jgi:hypothetical protein
MTGVHELPGFGALLTELEFISFDPRFYFADGHCRIHQQGRLNIYLSQHRKCNLIVLLKPKILIVSIFGRLVWVLKREISMRIYI